MRPPWGLTTRIAARIVAAGFRLLPRRRRFGAATIVARLFASPIAWLLARRAVETETCGGAADRSLRVMIRLLTWSGVPFDPRIRVDAPAGVDAIAGKGAIFVSGHFPLNGLLTRALHDLGIRTAVLKALPQMDTLVWGTETADDTVTPSANTFLTFRRALAENRPVILEIDSGTASRRTVPFEQSHVSTAVFDFAHRVHAPLFFFAVRAEGIQSPLLVIREICGWSEDCCKPSSSCVAEFLSFLQSYSQPPAPRRAIDPTRRR